MAQMGWFLIKGTKDCVDNPQFCKGKSHCISSKYRNLIWFVAQCSNIDEFSYQKNLCNFQLF